MTNVRAKRGFELRELRLCGPRQADTGLRFTSGLNVIQGASNTGKSYALSCIDFVLGAGTSPEEFSQNKAYDVAYLEIFTRAGTTYSLKRALVGGAIGLIDGSLDQAIAAHSTDWKVLGEKNNAKNSVSKFLLELCGIEGQVVRKNSTGETKAVSFRILAKAVIIDENRMIAKKSPLYTSQNTQNTEATSTIRMLLTGHDDSAIVQQEDKKTAAVRLAGRIEIMEDLIQEDEASLEKLASAADLATETCERMEARLRELSELASLALEELRRGETQRYEIVRERRDMVARYTNVRGMLARANLLTNHYTSDLARLDATGESAQLLMMFAVEPCACCGAAVEHQNFDAVVAPAAVFEAARIEAKKIRSLQHELQNTIRQMSNERAEVEARLEHLTAQLLYVTNSINEALTPGVCFTGTTLQDLQEEYGLCVKAQELRDRLAMMRQKLVDMKVKPSNGEKIEFTKLTSDTMAAVCQRVGSLLMTWGVISHPNVAFDEKSADLLVNGHTRKSNGKGVRAIMLAGYVIGLMQECVATGLKHPGFVILDTPLNPYREADPDDEGVVATSVRETFYRDLSASERLGQVVIFENVPPPDDVQRVCNYVHFSGSDVGRRGLLPSRPTT